MAAAPEDSLADRQSLVIKSPEQLRDRLGRETLLVTGSPRGATSLVAYVLLRGGYPLSSDRRARNHEDPEIVAARFDDARLRAIIAARNAGAARWGFKLPYASRAIRWYAGELRNPVFVMIYRNPLAIARSIMRRQPGWSQSAAGLDEALTQGLSMMTAGSDVLQVDAPAILVDVDQAKANPSTFVEELFASLAIEASEATLADIAATIASPGYRRLPDDEPSVAET